MMQRLFKSAFLITVFAYLYLPILILVAHSFNLAHHGTQWAGFSWLWYQRLWHNEMLLQALGHSMTVATLAATLATLMGSLTAVALYRYQFRGKRLVSSLLFIVMISPDIVMAISLLVLFVLCNIELGFWSLLAAHITFCLPFVTITVYTRLKGFDNKMLEAARDLGASELTILGKIIFPLALPAIVSGWLLSFTLSLDDVVVASFVTGPSYEILPLMIYSMIKVGVSPEINALTTLMLLFSLLLVFISQIIVHYRARPVQL